MKDEEIPSSPASDSRKKNEYTKQSVKCRVDQILAVTDENGESFSCSESFCSSRSSSCSSGCSSHNYSTDQEQEGEESILDESILSIRSDLHDLFLPFPENTLLVKLPGKTHNDACVPTESNFTEDIPLGGPYDDKRQTQSFRKNNPRWHRSLLIACVMIMILGGFALFMFLQHNGFKEQH